MSYQCVILAHKGGPDALQVVTREHIPLKKNEVRIKVQACGVGRTDLSMLDSKTAFTPKLPFVPGYEIVGTVEAVGSAVNTVKECDRVGALTGYGGYSEYITLQEEHLVPVPPSLDAGEAVAMILNYTTAYQMLVRVARVKAGDKVLITGASGGVGSALLDLGRMMGLKMFGTASKSKKKALEHFGAVILDYKDDGLIENLKNKTPEGVDFVFDGVGEAFASVCLKALKKGGTLVEYSFPTSIGAVFNRIGFFIKVGFMGKKGVGYGISMNYQVDKKPVLEDIAQLFKLLESGKVKPLISARLPLLDAAKANRILEKGDVIGKVVLFA